MILLKKQFRFEKLKKIKLPAAIIAATAKIHDLILISENTSDFNNIPGLKMINPNVF